MLNESGLGLMLLTTRYCHCKCFMFGLLGNKHVKEGLWSWLAMAVVMICILENDGLTVILTSKGAWVVRVIYHQAIVEFDLK